MRTVTLSITRAGRSLNELHFEMLERVLGCGAERKLCFTKIGASLHDKVVQLAAGPVQIYLDRLGVRFLPLPAVGCSPWWDSKNFFFSCETVASLATDGFWVAPMMLFYSRTENLTKLFSP